MTKEYVVSHIVTAWPQSLGSGPTQKEGYAVKVTELNARWVAKEEFEAAHIELGHASHLPEWQQRVVVEFYQLYDRLQKLLAFTGTDAFNAMPKDQSQLLLTQQDAMVAYYEALTARIEQFAAASITIK